MSAGTTAPRLTRTTSPGTNSVTVISRGVESRITTTRCVTRECNASDARSARNSLTNPNPMLARRITPITIEFVASPRRRDSPAVTINRIRMGLFNWLPSTDQALALCVDLRDVMEPPSRWWQD